MYTPLLLPYIIDLIVIKYFVSRIGMVKDSFLLGFLLVPKGIWILIRFKKEGKSLVKNKGLERRQLRSTRQFPDTRACGKKIQQGVDD